MHCIYGMDSNVFSTNASLHKNLVNWFRPSLAKNIVNAFLSTFPFLSAIYNTSFFPFEMSKWFYDTTDAAILHHHQNDAFNQRYDFMQYLLDGKRIKNYTNRDLTAFTATFFFDAFETSSMILAQALYYVASHQECQKKLRNEISAQLSLEQCPTMDDINGMQYLDSIVNGLDEC